MASEFVIPFLISNVFGVLMLVLALKWPNAARWFAGALFVGASAVNFTTAARDPQTYVNGFGPHAIGPYREFIYGPFAANPALFVFAIAAGQLAVGILLLTARDPYVKFGSAGAIVFLVAIAPLGLGSAFPSTVILAAAMAILYRRKWPFMRKEAGRGTQATMRSCGR